MKNTTTKTKAELSAWQAEFACTAEEFPELAKALIASSPYSLTHIATCLNVGRTTLYRALKGKPPMLMRKAIIDGLRLLQHATSTEAPTGKTHG